jgi:hypothetical protein
MLTKHQEFMDLKQGGRSVHDYSKLFNHLPQYAPEQVDTDDKKKASFMRGLSTKLKDRLSLSTGGTFPVYLSNAIIVDNAIRAHKEGKKRKAMTAPSGSAPPKGRVVHPTGPTNQPHQHQDQHHHQQWAYRPHQQQAPRALRHHRLCRACRHHRLLEPPPKPGSIVGVLAILHESAPLCNVPKFMKFKLCSNLIQNIKKY